MLNPHASFASFVVGSGNRLAATAARAVAEAPGAAYNPLFIYARPGLGKTHLLMAIGHEALQFDPSRTVEYVTVDDFVEAYHAALAAGQADAYRRRFTEADLVLLDDAQLLADRRELQSELLRLIDVLAAADRQIVLAGDRPPEEIQQLDERLIRRFAGGLVIDIGAPDYETRLAILSRRAGERQAVFAPDVLAAVAELTIGTVRELLGALNRLIAQQAVQDEPLTVAQARKTLATVRHAPPVREAPPVEAGATEPYAQPSPSTDEFSDFLSDLTSSVAQRMDRWRQRLTEAALRWAGEGFRTGRLDALLSGDLVADPEEALAKFDADVQSLRALQEEMAAVTPELLSEAVLHDPDRLDEARQFVADARETGAPLPGPSPRYTVEQFAAGTAARPAVEAIRAAAAAPGERYNPLVIVGPAGTGKTHLLHAFGHALRTAGKQRVAVLDGRQFVDELVGALATDQVARWRQRLRRVDAFLLDGVDALAGKERSQEELYLLHNILLESGRQMGFTASAAPSALEGFEERLATRLAGGLVVELGVPDREARRKETARLLGPAASDEELVEFLASRQASSLREVQQLVQRVELAAEQRGATLTVELARLLLDGDPAHAPKPLRRGSGLLAPGSGALRSGEKMIESWPAVGERLLEEWR